MDLVVENISVAYPRGLVLESISFPMSPGEVVALVGPNGVGKTTLIKAISGILPIGGGKITIDNVELNDLSSSHRARRIAVVPQDSPLGGALTVRQVVSFGRTPYLNWLGNLSKHDERIIQQAMEDAQVIEFADRRLAELSGGERQRVLLARALAQSTPVLLLDEPTNNLDLHHQSNLMILVSKLAKRNNAAVLMAMHDLNLVSLFADRVLLLKGKKLVADGHPAHILTGENLSILFGDEVEVISHPHTGNPLIFPKSN